MHDDPALHARDDPPRTPPPPCGQRCADGYGPVLIGLRGCGKSTVAPLLAGLLGLHVLDTDAELERVAGARIPEIFRTRGEAWFRRLEREIVLEALQLRGTVVATGGGAVLAADVRDALRRRYTVWLQAPPAVLAARIAGSERPALSGMETRSELDALLAARAPLYREAASLEIDTMHGTPAQLARAIADSWTLAQQPPPAQQPCRPDPGPSPEHAP
jgi:shikimate kinase